MVGLYVHKLQQLVLFISMTVLQSNCVQCNEIKCHQCLILCQLRKKLLNISTVEVKGICCKVNSTVKSKLF